MKYDLMVVRQKDLVTNPTTRLPVCLCLDTSSSMGRVISGDFQSTGETFYKDGQQWESVIGGTTAIDELNKGVSMFFDAIKEDEVAKYAVELAIVSFDSTSEKVLDFANIDRQESPILTTNGCTNMGAGISLALDLLEKRKQEYSDKGVDYYQPWLVLMSDGEPTDDINNAVNKVQGLISDKKLTVFSVAIGNDADISNLKQFSSLKDHMVLKVTSAEYFKEFFEWLSQSVSVASQSVPGDNVKLPPRPPVIEIEL